MKIRLIMIVSYVETIKDYPTTELNYNLTLSHIGQAIGNANRAYKIHDDGFTCTPIKGEVA